MLQSMLESSKFISRMNPILQGEWHGQRLLEDSMTAPLRRSSIRPDLILIAGTDSH